MKNDENKWGKIGEKVAIRLNQMENDDAILEHCSLMRSNKKFADGISSFETYSTVIKKSSPYDVLNQSKSFIWSHFQF